MAKLNGVKTVNMQDGKITKISYEGAEYAIREGEPKADDIVRNTKSAKDVTIGSFYIVNTTDENGDVAIRDDVYDKRSALDDFEVFRKVDAKPMPLEAKVDSLDKRVTALEAVKPAPKTFDDFSKGAKVRLLSGGGESPLYGFTDGRTYEVVTNDYDHRRGRRVQLIGGGAGGTSRGFATPEQLELVAKYKAEKRHAEVGERILITNAKDSRYGNGAVLRVDRVRITTGGIWANYKSTEVFVYASEYEVIVESDAAPTPAQSLTHQGADYTLVSRKAQPGDVVVLTKTGGDYFKTGKPYEVLDGVEIRDGAKFDLYKGCLGRTEETVLVYEPVKEALKVGDTVEVIDGSKTRYNDFKTGTVGKVTDIDHDYERTPIRVDTDDDFDRFPASALRKVAAAAKSTPKFPQKGDIVRVTSDYYGYGFSVGVIGVVTGADNTFGPEIKVGATSGYARVEIVSRAKDRVDVA